MAGLRRLITVPLVVAAVLATSTGPAGAAKTKPSFQVSLAPVARTPLGNAVLAVPFTCTVPKDATMQGVQFYFETHQAEGTPTEASTGQTYRWFDDMCDGKRHVVKVAVTSWTVPGYRPGEATVTMHADACWWTTKDPGSICLSKDIVDAHVTLKAGGRMPPTYSYGTFDLSIAKHGTVRHGQPTVTVRYVCSIPDGAELFTGSIYVIARQQTTPLHSDSAGDTLYNLVCDGTVQWTPVPLDGRHKFHPGRITVEMDGGGGWYNPANDDEGYFDQSLRAAVVKLHR